MDKQKVKLSNITSNFLIFRNTIRSINKIPNIFFSFTLKQYWNSAENAAIELLSMR